MHFPSETFQKCIKELQALSDELNDTWILHPNESEAESYLTKKQYLTENTEDGDNSPISIEYHVTFSESYGVPIMCINAWRMDGTLLQMEELWRLLRFTDNEDMYSTLTQMDHPVLKKPFLTLHPCRTAEMLSVMFSTSKNPVVSWLSAVAPIVKLNFDMNYMRLT